jgi:Fe/S biogenesis protein NfuA
MLVIKVTQMAKEKVLASMEAEQKRGHALRIMVQRPGTPMVSYRLAFDEPDRVVNNDIVVDASGFKIVMDAQSAPYLENAVLEYVSTLQGSGFRIIPQAPMHSSPEAEAVQRLIDERINPGVAGHGGRVTLVDVKDGVVYLRFGGGCQGCGMANATLKQGVEVAIKHAIPSIKAVMDVTDHANGKNPYFP